MTPREIEAANNKRATIQKYFLNGVRYCDGCGGTGLSGTHRYADGGYSWDGMSYCDKCHGIGYLNWKETITEKLCPICLGTGMAEKSNKNCSSCDGKGIVDWVRYMRLGGKRELSRSIEKDKISVKT
jgi:DnaJ-class molecular chaperone